MRKSLLFSAAIVFLAGLILFSCKKKENELDPMRAFMTSGAISINAGATSAVLSWKEAVNTDSSISTYTVEVSRDSAFATGAQFSYVVPGTSVMVTDTQLLIRTPYYARVKTNGPTPALDSKWVYSKKFSLTGEQIFMVVKDAELKHNSVILRWNDSLHANLVKIVLTPDGGTPTDYALTPQDIDSSHKKIEGLLPSTNYHAQIFSDTKEKGFIDFKTKDVPVYAYSIDSTIDLAILLDTCAPSIIIGLEPGTYTPSANCNIKSKSVTLMSVSGDPMDTKIIFKEFKLMGDGAGINFKDLSFDGLGTAAYFLNLAGLASDAAAASFANISVDNCRVSNYGNCFLRGNRGTAAGDHKIGTIKVNNTIVTNNTLAAAYTEFTLDKLAVQNVIITNSTFNKLGRAMFLMSTVLPASAPAPVILFDRNTVNNWGSGGTRVLLDANTNPVAVTISNNIFANTPRTGTLANDMIRATGTGTTVAFANNNYFKMMNGSAAALTIPANVTQTANQQIDLGWDSTTVDFKLPASSPLRTASSTGGIIGDPRWD